MYKSVTLCQVLHPRHKLKYFENAGWLPSWITAAKDIVRAEYEHTYAKASTQDEAVVMEPKKKVCLKQFSCFDFV
jgi:hypothetical protein